MLQQGRGGIPQLTQVPSWQAFPLSQSPFGQQSWPVAPQTTHVPLWQTVPLLQELPGQQVWPITPQAAQVGGVADVSQ